MYINQFVWKQKLNLKIVEFCLSMHIKGFYVCVGPYERKPSFYYYYYLDPFAGQQQYFGFPFDFQGQIRYFHFKVMMFGLSTSPYIFFLNF